MSYDADDMDSLKQEMNDSIRRTCDSGTCTATHSFSAADVKTAIGHLKPGKTDGDVGHCTDHLLHGTPKLNIYIALLFSSMVSHGCSPMGLMVSTILSIPKNRRKSLNDSDNYRGIALNSVLAKTFDWILLKTHKDALTSCDLQFGFKAEHSTTQCSYVVTEVIQYYVNGGGRVYALLLDASKAFDRVNYIKLLRLLLRKGMCPLIARLLAVMYSSQQVRVRGQSTVTAPFSTSNGVKQGGVLSPVLFAIYVDELLDRLSKVGAGCYIGNKFLGAFSYADDITLLAPTVCAVNKLLRAAEKFAEEYDMKFNPAKSKLITFDGSSQPEDINVLFAGAEIPCVPDDIHLGHVFGPDTCNKSIQLRISDMVRRANVLLAQFGHASSDVIYQLFKSLCMGLYGCQLWDWSATLAPSLYTAWRKIVRRIYRLPNRTHNALVHLVCNDLPPEGQLHLRTLKFVSALSKSSNSAVNLCYRLMLNGSRSAISNSLNVICQKYGLNKYSCCNSFAKTKRTIYRVLAAKDGPVDCAHASLIRDLISHREDSFQTDLSAGEVEYMIKDICCA